jgi:hypothetical protein
MLLLYLPLTLHMLTMETGDELGHAAVEAQVVRFYEEVYKALLTFYDMIFYHATEHEVFYDPIGAKAWGAEPSDAPALEQMINRWEAGLAARNVYWPNEKRIDLAGRWWELQALTGAAYAPEFGLLQEGETVQKALRGYDQVAIDMQLFKDYIDEGVLALNLVITNGDAHVGAPPGQPEPISDWDVRSGLLTVCLTMTASYVKINAMYQAEVKPAIDQARLAGVRNIQSLRVASGNGGRGAGVLPIGDDEAQLVEKYLIGESSEETHQAEQSRALRKSNQTGGGALAKVARK